MSYNIFQELDLTPPMPEGAVIAALDKKIESLNKLRLKRSSVGPRYEHFKRIKADIERNPRLIAEHAASFGRIAEEQRRQAEEQLRRSAAIYVVNGFIEEVQLRKLVKNNPGLDEKQILDILGAKVKGKRTFTYSEDPNIRETDALVMKTIRELLDKCGKKDLYDLLSLSPKTDTATISRVCDQLYLKSQTEGSLEERTTLSSLVGHAKSLLLDAGRRAGYDKALARAGLAPVRDQMQAIAAGSSKVIAPTQYDALLQTCTRAGIPRDRAEYYIYTEAEKLGLTVMEGDSSTMICRFCGSINPAGAQSCKTCAMPLTVTCPSCGRQSDNHEELRCIKCGFAIGEMPRAKTDVEAAEQSLRYGNIDEAERHITLARNRWPGYRAIEPVAAKIEKTRAGIATALREVSKLAQDKKFYTAKLRLPDIGVSPEAENLRAQVESAISQAEELITQAAKTTDVNGRLDLYIRALSVATDCVVAADKLRVTPPSPPSSCSAIVRGRTVTVTWPRLDSSFMRYRVIRKEGARPTSATDGTVIGDTAAATIDDTGAMPGKSYFYAIFSMCGEILSHSGAATPFPVLIAADISPDDILAAVEENRIKFSFKLPTGATGIQILRDGTPVKTVTGASYIDGDLITGRNYRYRFVTIYRDATGKTISSQGVEMTLSPTAPPQPVELHVEETASDRIRLSWTQPANGTLVIYVADRPVDLTFNETVAIDRIKWPQLTFTGKLVELRKDFCGIRYYLPVTVVGNIGVAGRPVRVDSIKEPEGVTLDKNDSFANLRWKWGSTPAVRVEWQIAGGRIITRDIAASQPSQVKIEFPPEAPSVKVTVRSLIESPEGPLLSAPVEKTLSLKAVRVNFSDARSEAKFGLFNRDKYSIAIRCDSALPCGLSLLIGEGAIPTDLVNLIPNFSIPASVMRPGEDLRFDITYNRRDKSRPLFFRLVSADRNLASLISITPESRKIK